MESETTLNIAKAKPLAKNKPPSWEFSEPMPRWLTKAKKMYKELKAQTDAQARCKSSLRPMWLSEEEFVHLNSVFASALDLNSSQRSWTVLVPAAECCLTSLSKLNDKQLQKIGEMLEVEGVRCGIHEMRKMIQESKGGGLETTNADLFADSDYSNGENTQPTTDIVEEVDCEDLTVRYIVNLLRYICEMIAKQITPRKNTERDLDVFIRRTSSRVWIKYWIAICSGETVLRALRDCRSHALKTAEGHHIDWIFTPRQQQGHIGYDQDCRWWFDATSAACLDEHVLPDLSSCHVYGGGNFYASMELARLDIPTTHKELREIVNIGRIMLQVTVGDLVT
ncbi:hypothetical protein BC938DRAFT_478493 [Jimgerdemannia flammicorona]|uniref:Uncharacterized protein n=1 Tax=Jimgerdemannia flammicorona TaxID=994334 RepID=A0A433QMS1_9FUNG|nr:hypothetical protein BC938DRAFT_478493 [Jimgerdemannia flammicorona]